MRLKVKLLVLCLSVLLMQSTVGGAVPAKTDQSPKSGIEYRVIHFPQNRSLGTVSITTPINGVIYPSAVWRRWANAYREVRVPVGTFVRLAVPQSDHDVVIALKTIKPDNAIQSLELGGAGFKSNDWQYIQHLTDLRALDLSADDISDQSVSNVKYFPNLQMLHLSRTNVGDAALKPISMLHQLRTLNLDNDRIDDQGMMHLAKLSRLARLDLNNNNVCDGIRCILDKPLYGLNLNGTKANDDVVKMIASKKPPLNYLFLHYCKITDKCVPYIGKLQTLKFLNVEDTPLSQPALQEIGRMLPQCRVVAGASGQTKEYRKMAH